MIDTAPDLKSYQFALRRLWWVVVVVALLGAWLGAMVVGAPKSKLIGSIQVPSLVAVVPGTGQAPIAPPSGFTGLISDRLGKIEFESGKADFANVASSTTIEVTLSSESDELASSLLAEVDDALEEFWQAEAPRLNRAARSQLESQVKSTKGRIAALGNSPVDAAERAQLGEILRSSEAILAGLEAWEAESPVMSVFGIVTKSSFALLPALAGLLVGAFVGVGVVAVITLSDSKVRRRSMVERNGLPVVAVLPSTGGAPLAALPVALEASVDAPLRKVSVVPVDGRADVGRIVGAVATDSGFTGVVSTGRPMSQGAGFVDDVRGSDCVILVATTGRTTYRELFESARIASSTGAGNICAALVVEGGKGTEART